MLTFKFTGADGVMTVQEILTTGMVGKQVRIEFTSDWDGLQKTAVFVAGDVSRAVINVEELVTIPAEVLRKPNQRLYVGIYGMNGEGTLIIPTIMAKGPKIEKGAEPSDDPTTDPDPAVWQQMLTAIGDLNDLDTAAKTSLVAAINEAANKSGATDEQIAAAVAEYMENNPVDASGWTKTAKTLLITILRNGVYTTDQSANITALETELGYDGGEDVPDAPEVTLSSISAVYDGGDVAVGTAVSDLIGIVVTAHYSDGTSSTVTGYTLSGEIAEGENTITVTYQGMTTTFAVTGIAESGGETEENNGWADGQAYELNKVDCLSLDTTTGETVEASTGTMVTDFLPCLGVSAISWEGYDKASIMSNVLYDEEKNFIKANGLLTATDPAQGATNVYTTLAYYYIVPKGSAYIRLTQRSSIKYLTSVTPHKYPVLTETTECETGRWYESGAVHGSLNANNGTLTVDDAQTWYVTGYCMVYGASKAHFSTSTRKTVVFYDGNKNYISGATVNTTTAFDVPENAVYMAASSTDMNNMHIWLEA